MSTLLLKARPTERQLADRLREPRPDGLELYLDHADIATEAAMDRVVSLLEQQRLSDDFKLLIEGPVRSLDGEFFDTSRAALADLEVIRRLAALAGRLRARAVNIHVIAPTAAVDLLCATTRQVALERSLELLKRFVDLVGSAGAVPTVENMPPVLRMREGGFFYTPIGMPPEDLVWLCERLPTLRTTLDISHAGLYVNCQRYAANVGSVPELERPAAQPRLLEFVSTFAPLESVLDYALALGDTLVTCHVANAFGLLGEGEPYFRGDLDLDELLPLLSARCDYFVTETLEPDPNRAVEMRRALAAMRRVLRSAA